MLLGCYKSALTLENVKRMDLDKEQDAFLLRGLPFI